VLDFWQVFGPVRFLSAGFWLLDFCRLGIFGTGKISVGGFCVLNFFLYANLCTRKFFFARFCISKIFFLRVLVLKKIIFGGLCSPKNFFFVSVCSFYPLFFSLRTLNSHFKAYFNHLLTLLVIVLLLSQSGCKRLILR
jgi:hypothetical protein